MADDNTRKADTVRAAALGHDSPQAGPTVSALVCHAAEDNDRDEVEDGPGCPCCVLPWSY